MLVMLGVTGVVGRGVEVIRVMVGVTGVVERELEVVGVTETEVGREADDRGVVTVLLKVAGGL